MESSSSNIAFIFFVFFLSFVPSLLLYTSNCYFLFHTIFFIFCSYSSHFFCQSVITPFVPFSLFPPHFFLPDRQASCEAVNGFTHFANLTHFARGAKIGEHILNTFKDLITQWNGPKCNCNDCRFIVNIA